MIVSGFPPFILPPPEPVARAVRRGVDGRARSSRTSARRSSRSRSGSRSGPDRRSSSATSWRAARSSSGSLSPYLVAAQATPILALAPLSRCGSGRASLGKVVICALIVFFPVAVATMVGIRSVDARLLELGAALRATAARS